MAGAPVAIYNTTVNASEKSVVFTVPTAYTNGCAIALVQPTADYGTLAIETDKTQINKDETAAEYEIPYTVTYTLSEAIKTRIEQGNGVKSASLVFESPLTAKTENGSYSMTGAFSAEAFQSDTKTLSLTGYDQAKGNMVLKGSGILDAKDFRAGDSIFTSAVLTIVTESGEVFVIPSNTAKTDLIELKSHTVTYDANGGENGPAQETYLEGETVQVTEEKPVRSGMEFTGWNTERDGSGTMYAAGTTFTMPKEDVILYAQWKEEAKPVIKTGGLTVSKTVSGNAGDTSKAFTFTVTLGDRTANGTYGDMTFVNGIAAFTLKHGESKTAVGIPAGVAYTVTESGNEGYTVTATGDKGVIREGVTVKAEFQNSRNQESSGNSGSSGSSHHSSTSKPNAVSPKTGDTANVALWISLILLFAASAAGIVVYRKKKSRG